MFYCMFYFTCDRSLRNGDQRRPVDPAARVRLYLLIGSGNGPPTATKVVVVVVVVVVAVVRVIVVIRFSKH